MVVSILQKSREKSKKIVAEIPENKKQKGFKLTSL